MTKICAKYQELYRDFNNPKGATSLFGFVRILSAEDCENLCGIVERASANGFTCIIPDIRLDEFDIDAYRKIYDVLLSVTRECGISLCFNLDEALERYAVEKLLSVGLDVSRVTLVRDEYFCDRDEVISLKLKSDSFCALIAFAPDTLECTDLTPFVSDGRINWQARYENWIATQYYCKSEPKSGKADRLSYESSMKMIRQAFSFFEDIFIKHGDTLTSLYYRDICFDAHNRLNWSNTLNELVIRKHGVDPSPFYAGLYNYTDDKSRHIKTLVLECRAELLRCGIIKALNDFTAERHLTLKAVITEPKLSASPFVNGDAFLDNSVSACALLEKSYLYGVNSLKLASCAAFNFGRDTVNTELFRAYAKIDDNIIRREAASALASGMSCALIHLPTKRSASDERLSDDFAGFITRAQAIMQGGAQVSDIALLYPIYSLYSKSHLYEDASQRFEYPDTPVDTDYMTLISSISTYSGHDLMLIHPEVFNRSKVTPDARLILDENGSRGEYKIIVLPSTEMISVQSILKLREFFECGGKIIATGSLPRLAFEYDPTGGNDELVRETVDYIFGPDASDKNVMKEYCYNSSPNGGEAFYLYFSRTAADGTNMTLGSTVHTAINHFDIPLDIYIPKMPRLEVAGALNNPYPEFVRLHLNVVMPGGGMFSHIHKTHGGLNVYYFSNATNIRYDHEVYLRGALAPEAWNPHDSSILSLDSDLIVFRDEVYTRLRLLLDPGQSIFIVSDNASASERLSSCERLETISDL